MSQAAIEILKEFGQLVLTVIGLTAFVTIVLLLFAVVIVIFFILYLPVIFDSISKLGIYHRLIKTNDNHEEECFFGEKFPEKVKKVFKYNFIIAIPLFLVILFLLHSQTSESVDAIASFSGSTVLSLSDISFFITLAMVPAFLLSFRLLSNPTKQGLFTFENGRISEVSSSVHFFICLVKERKIPEEPVEFNSDNGRLLNINLYKEQIKSLYFSFICTTLLLLLLFVFLKIEQSHGTYDPISDFSPSMYLPAVVIMVISEILAIAIISILGEIYLKWADPVDQSN